MEDFEEVTELVGEARVEQSTPATPPPPVKFDRAQKDRVDEIVREAMGRAGREAREKAARLELEVATLKATQVTPEPGLQEIAAQLAEMKTEKAALLAERQERAIVDRLRKVAGDRFVDSALALRLLREEVQLASDGSLRVVDEVGVDRRNETLDPMSIEDLIADFADRKPFLVRGSVMGGTGSTESQGQRPVDREMLSRYFGPKANGKLANHLAQTDYKKYKQLQKIAKEQGL